MFKFQLATSRAWFGLLCALAGAISPAVSAAMQAAPFALGNDCWEQPAAGISVLPPGRAQATVERWSACAVVSEESLGDGREWFAGVKRAWFGALPSSLEFKTSRSLQFASRPGENPAGDALERYGANLKWYWLPTGNLMPYVQSGGRFSLLGNGWGGLPENSGAKCWKCDASIGLGVLIYLNARTTLQGGALFWIPGPSNWHPGSSGSSEISLDPAHGYAESAISLQVFI